MMSSGDGVPSTIVCHFSDELDRTENDDDIMMDVLEISTSIRSYSDSHLLDSSSSNIANGSGGDRVTKQDLSAMKDMIASMRRNPELLNESPVMQRACLISSSQLRNSPDISSPSLTLAGHSKHAQEEDVKAEDLVAMRAMIASMRKNPELLYQSPIMQKACRDSKVASRLVSPFETEADTSDTSQRRPLGSKLDPSTLPSLPFSSIPRSVSIDKNNTKAPPSPPPAVFEQSSKRKMDTNVLLSKMTPRSI